LEEEQRAVEEVVGLLAAEADRSELVEASPRVAAVVADEASAELLPQAVLAAEGWAEPTELLDPPRPDDTEEGWRRACTARPTF
jgi:hypothetical protein